MRWGRKAFDIRGPESKRRMGRTSTKAFSPLTTTFAQHYETIIRAEKNAVAKTLWKLAVEFPNKKIWEVNKVKYATRINPKTGLVERFVDPRYKLSDNVLAFKNGGTEYHITLNDAGLAKALKNLGEEKLGIVNRAFGVVNRHMARVNTSLSPEFMGTNFLRDLQEAGINLTAEQGKGMAAAVMKDVPAAMRGSWQALREKGTSQWSKYFREFEEDGGRTAFFGLTSVEDMHKDLTKEIARAGDKGPLALTRKGFDKVMDFVEHTNGAVENAVRLSAYVQARKRGTSRAKAANLAKNLTVNFNRKGEAGPFINNAYLFYNANIQGTYRVWSMLAKKNPGGGMNRIQKIAATLGAISFGLNLYNRAAAGEDEDGQSRFDKLTPWIRDRNLIFYDPAGSGKHIKIPLPYGYSIIHVFGNTLADMMNGPKQDPVEMTWRVIKAFVEAFNPLGSDDSDTGLGQAAKIITPTPLKPGLEQLLNEDFKGSPLLPDHIPGQPEKPDSERYFSTVSPSLQKMTTKLNTLTGGNDRIPGNIDVSPETLEHLIQASVGSAGSFYQMTSDFLRNPTETPPERIPGVRRVYGTKDNPYYDMREYRKSTSKLKPYLQRKTDIENDLEEGDSTAVEEFEGRYPEEAPLLDSLEEVESELRDLRADRKDIREDLELTPEERKKQLDTLTQTEQVLMRQWNKFVRDRKK